MINNLVQNKNDNFTAKFDNIILPEEEIKDIKRDELSKGILATILDSLGLGIASKAYEIADKVQERIKETKIAYLLSDYFTDLENMKDKISKFEKFVTDPIGNTIFSKVIRVINTNPPNKEYIKILSKVLKHITNSDFQNLFSKHNYVLSEIEQLTPQALIILSDYRNWPEFEIGNYSSRDGVITSLWIEEFVMHYCSHLKISEDELSRRISHSTKELLRIDLIRAYIQGERDSKEFSSLKDSDTHKAVCELTELGREIIDYLD